MVIAGRKDGILVRVSLKKLPKMVKVEVEIFDKEFFPDDPIDYEGAPTTIRRAIIYLQDLKD